MKAKERYSVNYFALHTLNSSDAHYFRQIQLRFFIQQSLTNNTLKKIAKPVYDETIPLALPQNPQQLFAIFFIPFISRQRLNKHNRLCLFLPWTKPPRDAKILVNSLLMIYSSFSSCRVYLYLIVFCPMFISPKFKITLCS